VIARLATAVACVLSVGIAAGCRPRSAPAQPIAFDHSIHLRVQLDHRALECVDCHHGAEHGARAGLPALTTCLRCHMRPQGAHPSELEAEVRVLAAAGGPFRWIQVTRNPGIVYFSHRAHVQLGGMTCADCHGDVARWRRPPTVPNQTLLDMGKCLDCHRARGAPTDCVACHQ